MRNFDNISDKIDQYLLEELSDEERNSFQQMIDSDPELQEELAFRKRLIDEAVQVGRSELKTKIQRINVELKAEASYSQKRNFRLIAGLGISMAAIIVLFFLLRGFQPKTYGLPPEIEQSEQPEKVQAYEKIRETFEKKDHHRTLQLIDSYLNNYPNDPSIFTPLIKICKGISYWELEQYQDAEQALLDLKSKVSGFDKALVHWYLALTYWKQNEISKAKEELELIETYHRNTGVIEYQKLLKELSPRPTRDMLLYVLVGFLAVFPLILLIYYYRKHQKV